MDLKTGRHQGLGEPRFLLPSLKTSLSAPAVAQCATRSCEGRNKPISQGTEKRKEKGTQDCTSGGHWLFLDFKLPSKLCSALVPASPNMKPGHPNPHVNCKTLPSHPFRRCPFFQGKAAQFKQSVPHASHILFSLIFDATELPGNLQQQQWPFVCFYGWANLISKNRFNFGNIYLFHHTLYLPSF